MRPCKVCGKVPIVEPPRYKRSDYRCNPCHRAYCAPKKYKSGKPHKGWWREYYKRPEIVPKRFARQEVLKALQRGDLVRKPCQECGERPTDAHHPDYSKPLVVDWLCKPHHRQLHLQAEGK